MEIKPYTPWMRDEFHRLFVDTAGEMNVQGNEVNNRVSELTHYYSDRLTPFFTAWADGKMVGYAIAKRDGLGYKASSAHVAQLRIAVHSDYQAQGIGTNLVKEVLWEAEHQGVIKRIEILNYETSIDDRHWFEKLGFVVEGRLHNRISQDGKLIDAYSLAYYVED